MHRKLTLAAAFTTLVGAAYADSFTDSIVSNLQDLGYEFIEIQDGIGQVKVEAIRGTDKLEVIYDRSTGRILKQERERAEADEIGRSGVQVRNRNRNFLDVSAVPATNSAFNREIVATLQAEGYDFIEIKNGPTQVKVEAIRGTEKLELIYDRETGELLKREVEAASASEAGRSGVEIDTRSRDFLNDDENDESDRSGRSDDEDDDEDNSGRGSDDDEDDDEDDSDESDDDESNSGSGSSGSDDDEDDED
ncbi:hypothetical protein [Silicimonas sp. MF1-12-2]|uniref:hypothetical protein n=1 Tax=Silicimonas sp. MF1-12-2 TaxID=3384793 RepID=UPI0039B37E17